MSIQVLHGDCREVLRDLPDRSVQVVCTSPPYYNQRDYKIAGQIGLELSPAAYVAEMVMVFRAVRRVLRDDGLVFLNLGDSFSSAGGAHGGRTDNQPGVGAKLAHLDGCGDQAARRAPDGIPAKNLLGIPWRVAFAMQDDGWILRSDNVWCLSGGTRVYARTQKGEMPTTIKDLVRLDPSTVQLWNGEKWTQVLGWSETPRPDKTYEIEFRNGQRVGCTANHEWPVEPCGNIRANELRAGDIVRRCRLPEPKIPKSPTALSDEDIGWFVGLYIAEGSRSEDILQIASHSNEGERFTRLRTIAESLHGSISVHKTSENGSTINVYGPMLRGLVETYVSGQLASGKHLHSRCWQRSDRFIKSVLEGYLSGDGHFDVVNNRWQLGFCANDELVADLRTIGARLGISVRLRRYIHKIENAEFPGYKGEIRFARSDHHNSKNDGEIVAIRESRARKFWDIGVEDEPHLFALASGILTHNSKPNGMPESVDDRPTRSHEYVFMFAKSNTPQFWTHEDGNRTETKPDPDYVWMNRETKERIRCCPSGWPEIGKKEWRRINLWSAHDYYYDHEAVRTAPKASTQTQLAKPYLGEAGKEYCDGAGQNGRDVKARIVAASRDKQRGHSRRHDGFNDRWDAMEREQQMAEGGNLRSVWWISPAQFREGHFAVMPDALAEICIRAGSQPGDMVLDPFAGVGTTLMVADRLQRHAIGIELNAAYLDMLRQRVRRDSPLFAEVT